MFDCTNLKNGDVIVLTNYGNRTVIINKIKDDKTYSSPQLYTYVELDGNTLTFENDETECFYLIENINFRLSTIEEKTKLYNEIGKYFTEEYDKNWYNHFTDSSYFDIQDFLFDVFCIKVEEYDNDLIYPDFINDIHQYIWNRLCEVTNEDVEHKENKMVNLDDACKWLENKLLCAEDHYPTLEFLSIIEYNSLKELINDFRKTMNK